MVSFLEAQAILTRWHILCPYATSIEVDHLNQILLQAGNLTYHLSKFLSDLERDVPPDFRGLGVIDFEAWFPNYDLHFAEMNQVYHNLSYVLAKQEHPDWPDYALWGLAKAEFEQASK